MPALIAPLEAKTVETTGAPPAGAEMDQLATVRIPLKPAQRDVLGVVLAAVAGLLGCLRFPILSQPISLDNQIYYFVAERFASGVPPHVSVFDVKNALAAMLTGGAIWAGRLVGIDDVYAARALSIVFVVATFALSWLAVRSITGNRLAACVAPLSLLPFSEFLAQGVMGSRPKIFLVTFILAGIVAAARRRPALLGLTVAASFLTWQPGILTALPALAVLVRWSAGRKELLAFFTAAALPVVAYECYFLLTGAIGEQIHQSLAIPFVISKPPFPPGWVLSSLLGWDAGLDGRAVVMTITMLWLFAALAIGIFRSLRRRTLAWIDPGTIYVVVGAAAAVGFCFTDYQDFPDRFFVLPFAAVGLGLAVSGIRSVLRLPGGPRPVLMTTTVVLAALLLLATVRVPRYRITLDDQRRAAATVSEWREQGSTVYAVGCLHLLALAHMDNYHRYGFLPYRTRVYIMDDEIRKGRRFGPLDDAPAPDVILWSRLRFNPVFSKVKRNYSEMTRPWPQRQGVSVWLRDE